MSKIPAGCKLVLDPRDDFNHEPDDVSNYNESMYFSVFDSEQVPTRTLRSLNQRAI